ncbi:OmpA family protein [Loktanella agnita]|uniref:OmpA family protein n=1 Tax=Loktanella agnita TaxID=287097 RepID=UPI003987B504
MRFSQQNLGVALLGALSVFVGSEQVNAQQRAIINPSFEQFAPGYTPPANFEFTSDENIVGWNSTGPGPVGTTGGFIELWRNDNIDVPSDDGDYFVELNGESAVRLAQEVCLIEGEDLTWAYSHRARAGADGAPQQVRFDAQALVGSDRQVFDTSSLPEPRTNEDGTWAQRSGSTVFNAPTGIYDVGFESLTGSNRGNFLDNISFVPAPLAEFAAATSQGSELTGANLPEILISGVVGETSTITLVITGNTATAGVDFTIDNTTITVPPGTYDGSSAASRFAIPITIINDAVVEGDETIDVSIQSITSAGAPSTRLKVGDIQCAGPAQSTSTYTIVDASPEIEIETSNGDVVIADGGTDVQGSQTPGTPQTITYTISNTGEDTLTIGGTPTISGETNIDGPVIVSAPGSLSLTPGQTTTFTVTFTTLAEGQFGFDIDVASNDADESPYDIAVSGVDIDVIEDILTDDLTQTTMILSGHVSTISRRAADRLRVNSGQVCGNEINELLRARPVQFATDSYFIDARNDALLDRITQILNECDSSRFLIEGHTDSDASDSYNLTLSQNRVNQVRAALIRRGIADQRLQTRGYGERRPIATNATEQGKALNRRVAFVLLDGSDAPVAQSCDAGGAPRGYLEGGGTNQGARLTGNFASQADSCATGTHTETWGDLDITHDADRGTLGVASFGMSRDRQANGILRGRFIEGYLSKNDVETDNATGTITGFGIHGGLYASRGTAGGLILSYYGSAAVGQHSFELDVGADVDGNYTYAGVFAGGSVGGESDWGTLSVKPRVGVDVAYAEAIGSEISVANVELSIDPATYARAFVELGLSQDTRNGVLDFAPRAFCETDDDVDAEPCGFGAAFAYETHADTHGAQWRFGVDYEAVDDRQSASVRAARSRRIFDNRGVTRSTVSATDTGALQAGQTVTFAW